MPGALQKMQRAQDESSVNALNEKIAEGSEACRYSRQAMAFKKAASRATTPGKRLVTPRMSSSASPISGSAPQLVDLIDEAVDIVSADGLGRDEDLLAGRDARL